MQITHAEAHRLIQFNADNALNQQEKNALASHLQDCSECRLYAEEIAEVESSLLPAMQRWWNLQPLPLSIDTIRAKRNTKTQASTILATRKIAISVMFLVFIFSVWQFALSDGQNSSPVTAGVPPIPTPSTQSTRTKIMFRNCEGMVYQVQENDTLESIADQFSVPKEDLLATNSLQTGTVNAGMEIIVPICNFTPTGTLHPAILPSTYTPSIHTTTFTPDG